MTDIYEEELLKRVERICRIGLSSGSDNKPLYYRLKTLHVHATPAYFRTRYDGYSVLIQLVTLLVPALPLYVIRWRRGSYGNLLDYGIVELRISDERNVLAVGRRSLRLVVSPEVKIAPVIRYSEITESANNDPLVWLSRYRGLTWLSLYTTRPVLKCNDIAATWVPRLYGVTFMGSQGFGSMALAPFVMFCPSDVRVIDPWRLEIEELNVHRSYSIQVVLEGIKEICKGDAVIFGLAWVVYTNSREGEIIELRPVVYGVYWNRSSLAAPLAKLVFSLILRLESANRIAKVASNNCHCESNKLRCFYEYVCSLFSSVYSSANLRAVLQKINDATAVVIHPKSVIERVKKLLAGLDIPAGDSRLGWSILHTAINDAASELGCRKIRNSYKCTNSFLTPLKLIEALQPELLEERIQPVNFARAVISNARLAASLYRDTFRDILQVVTHVKEGNTY